MTEQNDAPSLADPGAVAVPLGLEVDASALKTLAKGQLRVWIAALFGAMVLRNLLPAWLVNDQTVDIVAGAAGLALIAGWTWIHDRVTHSRFFSLALDRAVPQNAVRLKGAA